MGLDLYAGTLTRYYARNWKTVTQQWAEANGYGFQRIAPNEAGGEELPPAQIQEGMENWRDQVLAALSQPGREPYQAWAEDNEKTYYTDKPDWDAFGALLLVAACHVYGEPVPAKVSKNWSFPEHPLIQRLAGDGEHVWSLARGTTWWLPLPDGFLVQGALPTGNQAVISTTAALRAELEGINNLVWQAGEDTVLDWSRTEGYPADSTFGPDGALTMGQEHLEYDTQSLAKYAFSIFWQALQFAEENQVPILMDY